MSAQLSPYLVLILVGFLPNEVWRMLGIVAGRGLDEDSEIVLWVRAVATGVLAGRDRQAHAGAARRARRRAAGGAARRHGPRLRDLLAARRSVFAGVVAGEAVLIVGAYLFR